MIDDHHQDLDSGDSDSVLCRRRRVVLALSRRQGFEMCGALQHELENAQESAFDHVAVKGMPGIVLEVLCKGAELVQEQDALSLLLWRRCWLFCCCC